MLDPSLLSIKDKIEIIGQSKVIICEGSGAMNSVLFGADDSLTIWLADPDLCLNENFLYGSWPYQNIMAHRTSFIVGEHVSHLPGSPLAACRFSIDRLKHLLSNKL